MVLLLVSVALALAPADNADFKRGNELFAAYKYPEARAAMAKARAAKGLDRATLLRILEVQGVAAAQQRQTAAAQTAFRELMVLDPSHSLEAEYAPRVMTPFFEARQAALEGGALEFNPGPVETSPGRVDSVSVVIARDPMKMARAVRFHLNSGGAWQVTDATPEAGRATLRIGAAEANWWAELLGDNETQLQLVGSEAAPRADRPPAPVAVVPPPPMTPPPEVAAPARSSGSPVRTASYFVLGGALVAGGVGGYFAYSASVSFSKIDNAARTGGVITGLTEKAAYDLNATGKQNATIGNALFIGGGALAVGAVVMWLVGGPSTPANVAISPTPNGVMVSGALP